MGLINNIFKKIADTWYPIGSYYITKTNTNPSSIVGGTWNLVHKTFKQDTTYNNPNNCFTFNTTNVSNGYFYVFYGEDCAYAQLCYAPKVAINDTGYTIGTLSTAVGGAFYANNDIQGRHTNNGYIVQIYLSAISSGDTPANLNANDCITYNAATSYSTGASVRAYFPILFNDNALISGGLDNLYSEWHWVRTA